jgi:hypothetical protein
VEDEEEEEEEIYQRRMGMVTRQPDESFALLAWYGSSRMQLHGRDM